MWYHYKIQQCTNIVTNYTSIKQINKAKYQNAQLAWNNWALPVFNDDITEAPVKAAVLSIPSVPLKLSLLTGSNVIPTIWCTIPYLLPSLMSFICDEVPCALLIDCPITDELQVTTRISDGNVLVLAGCTHVVALSTNTKS